MQDSTLCSELWCNCRMLHTSFCTSCRTLPAEGQQSVEEGYTHAESHLHAAAGWMQPCAAHDLLVFSESCWAAGSQGAAGAGRLAEAALWRLPHQAKQAARW